VTRYDTITFLSDFGLADEFVGVVHRVIRQVAPDAAVIDLTHQIPAHDVRAGALALWRTTPWLGPGVVLAVVDPGVGTDRRAVAVEAADGDLVLVGPDNGLLTPAAHLLGPPGRAVALTDTAWHLAGAGATFDGRDVFGPVAAHLCAGVDLADLGERFDSAELVGGPLVLAEAPPDAVARHGLEVEVLWVDRYGNAQLGVRPAALDPLGTAVEVAVAVSGAGVVAGAPGGHLARRARGYGDLAAGELGLIADSAGLLALCLDRASAADALGLAAGNVVRLGPAGDVASTTPGGCG
jgi:S-adenosyl-L-methionine hydrolase (adenosine-forming)